MVIVSIKTAIFYHYLTDTLTYSDDIYSLMDWLVYESREEREATRSNSNKLLPSLIEEIVSLAPIRDATEIHNLFSRACLIQAYLTEAEQSELAEFIASKRTELLIKELSE